MHFIALIHFTDILASMAQPLPASTPRKKVINIRQSLVEKELEARLKRHKIQLQYDAKLQSMREKELQLFIRDAEHKLATSQAKAEMKKRAFEAEERRKEEMHKVQMELLKKQYE